MLLILGAKFGLLKNESLKLHIYAAVVREKKRAGCSLRESKLGAKAGSKGHCHGQGALSHSISEV